MSSVGFGFCMSLNRRSSFLSSLPQYQYPPLPGLSSNDDMDVTIGESIGSSNRCSSGSLAASPNNNMRNNPILPSSFLYGDYPMSSRAAGCPSDYFWLNTSHPTLADQNSISSLFYY